MSITFIIEKFLYSDIVKIRQRKAVSCPAWDWGQEEINQWLKAERCGGLSERREAHGIFLNVTYRDICGKEHQSKSDQV